MTTVAYSYVPTPKQLLAHRTMAGEILFGGAAGGGKSKAGRAEAIRMAVMVPGSLTYVFRRTFPQLQQDVIPKFRDEMPPGVATYNRSEHTWYFANGSRIVLGHMQNEDDVDNYLSSEPSLCVFEELTQFTEDQYRRMRGRLRAAGPVLARLNQLGWVCRSFATSNPAGPGHGWVKIRFIDPGIKNVPWTPPSTVEELNPVTRCFIPAKLEDNPHMDPGYAQRLDNLEPGLRKAYRDGDWDILKGVRFTQWRASIHTVTPEQLPIPIIDFPRVLAIDWGIEAPFAALWMTLLNDGLIFVYRELYATGLTTLEQCELIKASEQDGERIPGRPLPLVMDPSMWSRTHISPPRDLDPVKDWAPLGSQARVYQDAFGRGNVKRAMNARVAGWALLDEHLRVRADGLPRLLVSTECRNLIRTLPSLPRAKTNPEDVLTTAEDHLADCVRYGVFELAGGGARRTTTLPAADQPVYGNVTAGLQTTQF